MGGRLVPSLGARHLILPRQEQASGVIFMPHSHPSGPAPTPSILDPIVARGGSILTSYGWALLGSQLSAAETHTCACLVMAKLASSSSSSGLPAAFHPNCFMQNGWSHWP